MREASAQLMGRDLLGRDFFVHGTPKAYASKGKANMMPALMRCWPLIQQRLRNYYEKWSPPKMDVLSIERARMRIERLLGKLDNWEAMDALIAADIRDPQKRRTTMASSFSALWNMRVMGAWNCSRQN